MVFADSFDRLMYGEERQYHAELNSVAAVGANARQD